MNWILATAIVSGALWGAEKPSAPPTISVQGATMKETIEALRKFENDEGWKTRMNGNILSAEKKTGNDRKGRHWIDLMIRRNFSFSELNSVLRIVCNVSGYSRFDTGDSDLEKDVTSTEAGQDCQKALEKFKQTLK